jgi:hypothetical protein
MKVLSKKFFHAMSRMVMELIPDEIIRYFNLPNLCYDPRVDSASERNEYQECDM